VHTTFGDLLRALDTPERLTSPSNLAVSREGFVVANFPGGHVVAFTANGNRLRHEIHNDHIQVNYLFVLIHENWSFFSSFMYVEMRKLIFQKGQWPILLLHRSAKDGSKKNLKHFFLKLQNC
jgi:hypothetical protein